MRVSLLLSGRLAPVRAQIGEELLNLQLSSRKCHCGLGAIHYGKPPTCRRCRPEGRASGTMSRRMVAQQWVHTGRRPRKRVEVPEPQAFNRASAPKRPCEAVRLVAHHGGVRACKSNSSTVDKSCGTARRGRQALRLAIRFCVEPCAGRCRWPAAVPVPTVRKFMSGLRGLHRSLIPVGEPDCCAAVRWLLGKAWA